MRSAALLVLISSPAFAEKPSAEEPDAMSIRASAGGEVATGAVTAIAGFRGHLAIDYLIHHDRYHRYSDHNESRLGLGVTVGAGEFFNDREPTSGARHMYSFVSYGPELVYTLDRIGEYEDKKLFATLALVDTSFDYQYGTRKDGWGGRATFGINWSRAMERLVDKASPKKDDSGLELALLILAPHQLEISVEHDPGTTRVGLVASYGY